MQIDIVQKKQIIKGNGLILRDYSQDDVDDFLRYINSSYVKANTTIEGLPWSKNQASWWISFILNAEKDRQLSEKHFVIEIDGKYVGTIGIINITGHKGELGYWLAKEYSGRNVMTKAVGLFCDYIFTKLKLIRIFAPVLPFNKASARVLEKNGFVLEGVLRKHFYKDGKYVDAHLYAKVK